MTKRPWAKIDLHPTAAADDGTSSSPSAADITLYGTIGADLWGDGISASDLARQIADLDVDELNVYVNSPGGAAWDGLAIMNALRRHKAKVTVTVDALAASAASVIAMAGDRIVMNRGSELMIHDASGWCIGNAKAMAETAQVLSKLSDSYAAAYAARAGGNTEDWRARMRAETWYTAEEAVLAGLADEWVDAPPAEARFDMSGFRYRGRAAAPTPVSKLPASEPEDHTTTIREETIIMTDELKDGLRDRLGLAEDVTETAILAALDERLDKIVDDAVRDGRIAPAARASWRAMADKDEEGTKTLLSSLTPNTVPVAEVGVGAGNETTTEDDRLYAAAWGSKEN